MKNQEYIHHILGELAHQSFPKLMCMVVEYKVVAVDLATDFVMRAQKTSAKICDK